MTQTVSGRRPGSIGVHSIDHFGLLVPDMNVAQRFYEQFGLSVRSERARLTLSTHHDPHRWGVISEGPAKRLSYLSFGIFEDDEPAIADKLLSAGVKPIEAPPGAEPGGWWIAGFDKLPINLRVAGKRSPNEKSAFTAASTAPGVSGAIPNSKAPPVSPRRLSHVAIFTSSIPDAIEFYVSALGLRLSDRSGDGVAFLHGAHGSDHHLLALVASDHRGLHHVSWDVGSVQEIGLGAAQAARGGYAAGWGLGRHVLGANYFYYVRDPWGSYCEYSADIDFIPADCDWPAGDHAPEDAMYLWGPPPPDDFATNYEPAVDCE
ncbi:MAG: VOC family protein [Parvibaculum sp.]|uniref:VOC family protein n=1 Tax=Parvibaculum sp. TaxID=2024848 RepID=UPI00283F699B|nr:VOC family protein [Parvibaculum sp.]MDR3497850.1 VOC family protein [Parvibaculum sp.]